MVDRLRMKDIAYNVIKNKIMSNEFVSGQYLEEKYLCELVGVSRTPIREAINQLEKDGFIENRANKGIFVTTIDIKKSQELFQARMYLEPTILELAINNIDSKELELFVNRTKEYIDSEDFQALNEIDYEFHNYIHSCCANSVLKEFANKLQDQFQRIRTLDYYNDKRILGGANEHLKIIEEIKHKNIENAKLEMKNHILSTQKYYYKSFLESMWSN